MYISIINTQSVRYGCYRVDILLVLIYSVRTQGEAQKRSFLWADGRVRQKFFRPYRRDIFPFPSFSRIPGFLTWNTFQALLFSL